MKLDIAFRVSSTGTIPADHGYLLYAALSRKLPWLHESLDAAVHPIRGRQIGGRRMALQDFSRVTIRADVDCVGQLLPLSGRQITLAGTTLLLGVPELRQLSGEPDLRSRIVAIKLSRSPTVPEDAFRKALLDQLQALDVTPDEIVIGPRRTMQVKGRQIVGYEVCLSGLSPEASLRVQSHGLGGRRRMGSGLFVPYDPSKYVARQRTQQSSEVAHG